MLRVLLMKRGYRYIAYDPGNGTGYAALRFDRDMTPWHWSWRNEHGLWSIAVHCPWAQFMMIGPFRRVA